MNNLGNIRKLGWLLVAAAAALLVLSLLLSIAGAGGLGFIFWMLLLIIGPAALVGLALLALHWFKVSRRTGRRL